MDDTENIMQAKKISALFHHRTDQLILKNEFFRKLEQKFVTQEQADEFCSVFSNLVRQFPTLIALAISNIDNEVIRVGLAVNLYQECGEGVVKKSHYQVFRRFLDSANITEISQSEESIALDWMGSHRDFMLNSENSESLIGLIAASEFLAEPALNRIYQVMHPLYGERELDWGYFTEHLILEKEHVNDIHMMFEQTVDSKAQRESVELGFNYGLQIWNSYFTSIAKLLFR